MRVVRSKERQYVKTKIVHASVKRNVPCSLIEKALVFPYRLQLSYRSYVHAVLYMEGKRVQKVFSYNQLGYIEAIRAAMQWIDEGYTEATPTLGSTSFTSDPSPTPGITTYRARASYYDEKKKRWRSKSFSVSTCRLHEDDKQHLNNTASLWLETYLITGKDAVRFKHWRYTKLYDDDKTHEWKS